MSDGDIFVGDTPEEDYGGLIAPVDIPGAKKRKPEEDAQEFDIFKAIEAVRENKSYWSNIDPNDFDLQFTTYQRDGADIPTVRVARRSSSDMFPLIYGPISTAMFAHMYPGGDLKEFIATRPGKKKICAESPDKAKYEVTIDLHEAPSVGEHARFMGWLQKVQERLVTQFLRHKDFLRSAKGKPVDPPNVPAIRYAEAGLAREWATEWKYKVRGDILARPENERTEEEKKMVASYTEDNPPPVPRDRIEEFLWANCLTRMDKCRRVEEGSRATVPNTETFTMTRKLFHFPNAREKEDIKQAEEEKREYFDFEAMREMVGDIVAGYAKKIYESDKRQLYTILPMYTCDGEQVHPSKARLRDKDLFMPTFYFSFMPWCPMNSFKVQANLNHITFIRPRADENNAAAACMAIKRMKIPGAVNYNSIAQTRADDAPEPSAEVMHEM